VPLHVEVRGSGPPLLLLHGFSQTSRLWGTFGERLVATRTVVAVDLPGHAGSDSLRADLCETAGLVADAVRGVLAEPADAAEACDVLGYSLGARVALHLLTGTDLRARRVVLIGGTAGVEDAGDRERRRASDNELADRLEASGDVEAFVDSWLRSPLFARLSNSDRAERSERLRNSASGLASSLRLCGTGTQIPLWGVLDQIACPVLAMAGSDDTRFAEAAVRIAATARHAVASLVPGGGHAVHLSQPAQAFRIVDHWLRPDPPDLMQGRDVSQQ
jgi:2-succinyl-6-hydroxy-2,4-cyclohexadiene-1-carboxylate synthase